MKISIYVKGEEWFQANIGWVNAIPTGEHKSLINKGFKCGAFAYFNQMT